MLPEEFLFLDYKRYSLRKPKRASKSPECRVDIIQRFPSEHRRFILNILSDPTTTNLSKLRRMVIDYKEGKNKFGCPCCPNARFQTTSKVEQHLRGQLGVRLFGCQWW